MKDEMYGVPALPPGRYEGATIFKAGRRPKHNQLRESFVVVTEKGSRKVYRLGVFNKSMLCKMNAVTRRTYLEAAGIDEAQFRRDLRKWIAEDAADDRKQLISDLRAKADSLGLDLIERPKKKRKP